MNWVIAVTIYAVIIGLALAVDYFHRRELNRESPEPTDEEIIAQSAQFLKAWNKKTPDISTVVGDVENGIVSSARFMDDEEFDKMIGLK